MAYHLEQYDIVITPDYGNGFITPNLARAISEHSRLLAVNTQINSGNRGHHVVTRYPKADFVVLNEPELRLATHDKHASLDTLARRIADKLCARIIMITRGSKGAMVIEMGSGNTIEIPALSSRVVDRTGAGDALLALATLCLAEGLHPEIAGFVGSCAAALEIQIVCNRDPVDPIALIKYASTLLK
jgi:sugar/nucleoside kinase (ribokinase family)